MTVSEVECVYVAKEGGQATTYDGLTSLEHLGSALSPETFSVVQSLLLHFTKVHVCRDGKFAMEYLDSRLFPDPPATLLLIPIELSDSPTEVSSEELVNDTENRSGLASLEYLTKNRGNRILDSTITAACLKHVDTTSVLNCFDSGVEEYTHDPPQPVEIQRLALMLYNASRVRTERSGPTRRRDSFQYETVELRPTEMQWVALQSRVQALYQSNNFRKYDKLAQYYMPKTGDFDVLDGTHNSMSDAQMRRLQLAVSSWTFSTLEMSEADLVDCAAVMFKHLLSLPGNDTWRLSDAQLYNFIHSMRRSYYASNPYHNFRHAVDVMQAVFYILLSSDLLPRMNDDCPEFEWDHCDILRRLAEPHHMLAACIVGIGHDVGHPGVNNAFLVTTKAPLALLYNDRSVLESMHCAALSSLLSEVWPATQTPLMRKIILDMIYSTDMALHFDYMTRLKDMAGTCQASRDRRRKDVSSFVADDPSPAMMDSYRSVLMSSVIKCGDISNVARPWSISKVWSNVLLREFYNQGRLEKSLNMPVTKVFNPELTTQANSQTFFINTFAYPLFSALQSVMPSLSKISDIIIQNRDNWTQNSESSTLKAEEPQHSAVRSGLKEQAVTSDSSRMPPKQELRKPIEAQHEFSKLSADDSIITASVKGESKQGFCLPRLFKKKKN